MIAALLRIHPEVQPCLISLAGVPIRSDVLYTNAKGQEKENVRKRAERNINQLQYVLRRVLDREEAVLYVTRCEVRPSLIDQFTVGFHARYFNRITLVLTNHRLLYFFVDRDGRWRQSLRVARLGDVESATIKNWIYCTLTVRFHGGKKEVYCRIPRRDVSKVRLLLPAMLTAAAGEISLGESPTSLCPECLTTLEVGNYQCERCSMRFKDEQTLLRRVLLVPGGGYFYTGQTLAGLLQLVADLYLIVMVVSSILFYQRGPKPGDVVATPGESKSYLAAALVFAGALILEKWGVFHHCRTIIRQFMPLQTSRKV